MAKQTYTEWIICPECEKSQEATIEVGVPWNTYIHICEQCDYTIMESDWIPDTDKGIDQLIKNVNL